ncbi:4-(cytidine 5'-diphospho)-2-C-methyl-D-erythritol kinase [Methylomagnum ishizawai]|uniref:4-(cytidine 5'-diphospho)-2-C-methyl-D-erythritol kinase n=1 Tax=Methylomagnum ishizawai TaxID=1760988 RepID=UPI001C32B321|nr:4-(cytidine 5'-diphospho)-2-C-methyl-D-erythritol kinase [Methylomagnum ishizawai]BBL76588.1 4-diphosphocytidyl-2-C-methyl-D-erythritol kinase [Methylomagnum ishizawai]
MEEIETLRLPAPAKLNLLLRIVGRRGDGYHLLQTVFQFIDRCDWITLGRRTDGEIHLKTPLPGVPPEADLTVRAARALAAATGTRAGVDIGIEKNLPMGGGLGGGSSDAATVLVGLNRLWNTGLSVEALMDLGLKLGADVPVFVNGRSAWAEGVGERLTPLDLPEPWYVVVVPPCHVATGTVFSSPNLTRDNKPITIADFLAGRQENHCLPVVMELYPEIGAAMDDLSRYSEPRLTGTGACVFAAFADERQARQAATDLGSTRSAFVAKGENLSPLQRALGLDPGSRRS